MAFDARASWIPSRRYGLDQGVVMNWGRCSVNDNLHMAEYIKTCRMGECASGIFSEPSTTSEFLLK